MTAQKIQEHTDVMRDAANEWVDRVDVVADEVAAASERLGKHARRLGEAVAEYTRDAERPATRVASAFDDLGREAKRSFERITGRRRRPWYSRLLFWR